MSYYRCKVRLYLQLFVGGRMSYLTMLGTKTYLTSLIRHAPPQTTGGKDVPNIVNKTCALLQTTGGKDVPNIVNKTCALLQTT
jgi:hypothetical protein